MCQWVTHCVRSVVGAVFGGITGIAGPVAAILTWLALTYSYRMIKLSVVTQVQKYLKVEDISGSDVTDSGHALAVSRTQPAAIQMATYASGNHMRNNMSQRHASAASAAHACKALYSKLLFLPYLRSCIKLDIVGFSRAYAAKVHASMSTAYLSITSIQLGDNILAADHRRCNHTHPAFPLPPS